MARFGRGVPKSTGRVESLRGGLEQCPERLGPGEAEALVLEVGTQHDVADAHEPGDRREDRRLEDAVLELAVEGDHQVGRRRRAPGDQLPGRIGPVHEPGVIGSMVVPQRYEAKSLPGISSTRVALPRLSR